MVINEIGIAVVIVIVLVGAFQLVTLARARRVRGRRIADLPPAAARLLAGRDRAIVYFHSPGCMPCRSMTPVIDGLIETHGDCIIKVDASADPDTAVAFGLRATPTLVCVRDGVVESVYLGSKDRVWVESLLS